MRPPARIAPIIGLAYVLTIAAADRPQRGAASSTASRATVSDATARIVASAQALLATLDDAGRMRVQFPFEGPQKTRWSNLPSGIFQREGLRLGDLTAMQREAVMSLLSTALSRDGYQKVREIMAGDEVLRTGQGSGGGGGGRRGGGQGAGAPGGGRPGGGGPGRGSGGPAFGQDEYYLAFLGTPSVTSP